MNLPDTDHVKLQLHLLSRKSCSSQPDHSAARLPSSFATSLFACVNKYLRTDLSSSSLCLLCSTKISTVTGGSSYRMNHAEPMVGAGFCLCVHVWSVSSARENLSQLHLMQDITFKTVKVILEINQMIEILLNAQT